MISDQRLPEMLGAEVLGIVREEFPSIVRIITTAYSDLESAIQAVNKGYIYQYVVKPWESRSWDGPSARGRLFSGIDGAQ